MSAKDTEKSRFSQNIIKYRKIRNLSQDDLAERTGISKRMISYYETHISNPPINNVLKIARALEVSLNDLIGEETETSHILNLFEDIDPRTLKKIMLISKLSRKDRATIYNMIDALIDKMEKSHKVHKDEHIKG